MHTTSKAAGSNFQTLFGVREVSAFVVYDSIQQLHSVHVLCAIIHQSCIPLQWPPRTYVSVLVLEDEESIILSIYKPSIDTALHRIVVPLAFGSLRVQAYALRLFGDSQILRTQNRNFDVVL